MNFSRYSMSNNTLEYKGYHARVEFDTDTQTLRGKIEGIVDFVNFESDSTGGFCAVACVHEADAENATA